MVNKTNLFRVAPVGFFFPIKLLKTENFRKGLHGIYIKVVLQKQLFMPKIYTSLRKRCIVIANKKFYCLVIIFSEERLSLKLNLKI